MLLPALQLTHWQRCEKRRRHARTPTHRTEAPCGPCRSEPGQARHGSRAARDDDFLALFRTLYEARELCLGRVDGMSLLPAIDLSQGQLAKQPCASGLASADVGRQNAVIASPSRGRPSLGRFWSSKSLNSKDLGVLVDLNRELEPRHELAPGSRTAATWSRDRTRARETTLTLR